MKTSLLLMSIVVFCEYAFLVQCALGLIGNAINLVVLLSRAMRSRTNALLAATAFADGLFLLALTPHYLSRFAFFVRTSKCPHDLSNATTHIRCRSEFYEFYIEYKTLFTFAANWFSAASSWLTVAVSLDRLWAIKSPLHVRSSACSWSLVLLLPSVFTITGLLALPHNFAFKVIHENGTSGEAVNHSLAQRQVAQFHNGVQYLFTVTSIVVQVFLPVLLLSILNSFLIYYIRHRREFFETAAPRGSLHSSKSSTTDAPPLSATFLPRISNINDTPRRSRKWSGAWARQLHVSQRRVTVMVVAIVSCYLITHVPSTVLFTYMYTIDLNFYQRRENYAFVLISNLFVVFGKVANFFLFCSSRSVFFFVLD
ncbi:Putative G-protein coupled receptor F59B2.13 [Toxocara canis]|uniref:Putative G-protein coupled receptor F59B2.13 n=1 Tax=Toxocara canis TaxID=6265 RepID=A0A0B2UYQ6_TOXCA|nr:Putative G-protein coupled receptor F59B2.13 [Toxocara canis]